MDAAAYIDPKAQVSIGAFPHGEESEQAWAEYSPTCFNSDGAHFADASFCIHAPMSNASPSEPMYADGCSELANYTK